MRVPLNVAPAIGKDGTIYSASRGHFVDRSAFLLAVNSDLTPKWSVSLRHRLHDGCGVALSEGGTLPPNGAPGGCREGANLGVDPQTNQPGDGRILDSGSSTPVVAPDGSIFFGAYTRYNYAQGHMLHFTAAGAYLESYPFGWDISPAVRRHGNTYSLVMKDNHYSGLGSYCNAPAVCPPDRTASNPADPEAYYISQVSSSLQLEWRFRATNTESCQRDESGNVSCVSDHPASFEWCMNAPAVDGKGVTYANSEDGWLYSIRSDGTLKQRIFQQLALGAAYTPTSLGADGRIYSQNAGRLFVVGR